MVLLLGDAEFSAAISSHYDAGDGDVLTVITLCINAKVKIMNTMFMKQQTVKTGDYAEHKINENMAALVARTIYG